eukprot:scaffold186504_cov28-Tisochrysis_lutea.AAC.3
MAIVQILTTLPNMCEPMTRTSAQKVTVEYSQGRFEKTPFMRAKARGPEARAAACASLAMVRIPAVAARAFAKTESAMAETAAVSRIAADKMVGCKVLRMIWRVSVAKVDVTAQVDSRIFGAEIASSCAHCFSQNNGDDSMCSPILVTSIVYGQIWLSQFEPVVPSATDVGEGTWWRLASKVKLTIAEAAASAAASAAAAAAARVASAIALSVSRASQGLAPASPTSL